jgi:hypothetical protein
MRDDLDGPRRAAQNAAYERAVEAMRDQLEERSAEPQHIELSAYRDAAMDTLKKGAPGLSHTAAMVLANSIARKCQAARDRLGYRQIVDLIGTKP